MNYPITLGILGGGQLAKMLAQSAYQLGMNIAIIENHPNSPAGDMTKLEFSRGWNNAEDLQAFIDASDIITLENEFIDPALIERIELQRNVFPNSNTLRLIQDKYIQKTTFKNAQIPVPHFQNIESLDSIYAFAKKFGYPFLLKSRTMGYDGYGNATIHNEIEIESAMQKFKSDPQRSQLYAEEYIDFSKELAIMIARNQSNEIAVYPVVESIQVNHICNQVIAPAEISENSRMQAIDIAKKCVETIDGIGIFGIELFLTKNDSILVNEIAPRPHNTGHYTIEACVTSQFENCIRAILNLPLGSTDMIAPAASMINLLGTRSGPGYPSNIKKTLELRNVSLHLYNKKESRIGRKMGHITTLGNTIAEANASAIKAKDAFEW